MTVPQRGVLFQTQKKDKVIQLVKYAKTLYENQPVWLKEVFPLSKPLRQQPELSLEFANGSKILGYLPEPIRFGLIILGVICSMKPLSLPMQASALMRHCQR